MSFYEHTFQSDNPPIKSTSRRPSGSPHAGKTSAQSSLAQWNEDWTLIADMTERRRIQNRIAQRNYRHRLKERLLRVEQASGQEKPSKKHACKHPKDAKDKPSPSEPSLTQPHHRDVLPFRIDTAKSVADDHTSSIGHHYDFNHGIDQKPFSSSFTLSPETSSHTSFCYPDFSSMFDDPVFDAQMGRRTAWTHQ